MIITWTIGMIVLIIRHTTKQSAKALNSLHSDENNGK